LTGLFLNNQHPKLVMRNANLIMHASQPVMRHSLKRIFHTLFMWVAGCCSYGMATGQTTAIIDTNASPVVFAPGVMSTPYTEWATSFTPDGQRVFCSRGAIYWTIVFSSMENGKWAKPKVASFSGRWTDTDPFVSPDGKRLFFISNRPLEGASQDKPQKNSHIWYVDRQGVDEWSAPHHLDSIVNLDTSSNYAPSVSLTGTLYFCSRDREGNSGMNSYFAQWLGDHYGKPSLLTFKGLSESQDPFIAPDGRYLIFVSGNDLYISFHQKGAWSEPQKLGPTVNNGDSNFSPCVSPDGKTLYYSSSRVQGFYKRDAHIFSYDELIKENESLFNGQPNILMIPIHLPS